MKRPAANRQAFFLFYRFLFLRVRGRDADCVWWRPEIRSVPRCRVDELRTATLGQLISPSGDEAISPLVAVSKLSAAAGQAQCGSLQSVRQSAGHVGGRCSLLAGTSQLACFPPRQRRFPMKMARFPCAGRGASRVGNAVVSVWCKLFGDAK